MNFTAMFNDYYEFNRRLDGYIHSYFRKLYENQEEVRNFDSYPIGKVTTIAEQGTGIRLVHYRFDETEFEEPYLALTWKGSYADAGLEQEVGVPLSEFEDYAKTQWELEEFESRVEGGSNAS